NPVCGNNTANSSCQDSSPDYFNACATISSGVNVPFIHYGGVYRDAYDGDAFVGIGNELYYNGLGVFSSSWREYVQIKLNAPLVAGQKYNFSFYAGAYTPGNMEIYELGVHFVNDSIIYQTM